MQKYRDKNEKVSRARTFILACFDEDDSPEKREHTIRCLLRIIRQQRELRLKQMMDADRYASQIEFIRLISDIREAARNESGGPLPLSMADQLQIDRLEHYKNLSCRTYESMLAQLLDISREELAQSLANQSAIESRAEIDSNLEMLPCPKHKKEAMQKALHEAWLRHINMPLDSETAKQVLAEVKEKVSQIETEARVKFQKAKMTPHDLMAFLNSAVTKMMKPPPEKREQRSGGNKIMKSKKIQKLNTKRLELLNAADSKK